MFSIVILYRVSCQLIREECFWNLLVNVLIVQRLSVLCVYLS